MVILSDALATSTPESYYTPPACPWGNHSPLEYMNPVDQPQVDRISNMCLIIERRLLITG